MGADGNLNCARPSTPGHSPLLDVDVPLNEASGSASIGPEGRGKCVAQLRWTGWFGGTSWSHGHMRGPGSR